VKHRSVALLFVGVLIAALLPATTAGAQAGDNPCWKFKDTERRFTRRINTARENGSRSRLSLDPELSKVARVHTWEMVRKAELHHTPTETLKRRVTDWIVLGENVGVGGSVTSLHQAFMNSKAHRDNVMHPLYRHVGVGVVRSAGRMWVTIVFEATTDPGTTLKMPRC
jgi:uncharacterized protein YkwD